ncbi:hypothetical protein ACFOYW_16615 [Gryllotalpicola reticulitermitis]|uniref:Uncharacterized protein n=1 Tax=Gryllotalpicola reticulitermitis TaxID=1184153 RepID=A0ABV8QBF6_9MICO
MTTTPLTPAAQQDGNAAAADPTGAVRPGPQIRNRTLEYEVPVDPAELTRCDACE